MSEKWSREDLKNLMKEAFKEMSQNEKASEEIERLRRENKELRDRPEPEINHADLKNLGFHYCPDGKCGDSKLLSDEEFEALEGCENCGRKIKPEWARCPECGESRASKED